MSSIANMLDERFGETVDPHRATYYERLFAPVSLIKIESPEIVHFLKFMESVDKSHYFSSFQEEEFTLIWLVDVLGNIRIAIEEAVPPPGPSQQRQFPAPKAIARLCNRLGHPALVSADPARVGGEIYYDNGEWIINNRSGRYGLNLGRQKKHLDHVALSFEAVGIKVEVDFLES